MGNVAPRLFMWATIIVLVVVVTSSGISGMTLVGTAGNLAGQTTAVLTHKKTGVSVSSQLQHQLIQSGEHAAQTAAKQAAKSAAHNAQRKDSLGGVLPGAVDRALNSAASHAAHAATRAVGGGK